MTAAEAGGGGGGGAAEAGTARLAKALGGGACPARALCPLMGAPRRGHILPAL